MSPLRQSLRKARRALTPQQQLAHARAATTHLLRSPWLQRPLHLAVFLSTDGELDTRPLIKALWQRGGHTLYLPVLEHSLPHAMLFAPYTPQTRLTPNRYGIPEPAEGPRVPGCRLDAALVPLVGFDATGNRLGMGGGFYDRAFSCRLRRGENGIRQKWGRPRLIGWAHALQQVERLPAQPWDVPLDAVVTERGILTFRH